MNGFGFIDALGVAVLIVVIAVIVALVGRDGRAHHDAICARRFASARAAVDSLSILRDTLDDCTDQFQRAREVSQ